MNLAEALALADHTSPLPTLAGEALKVLRARLEALEEYATWHDVQIRDLGLQKIAYLRARGYEFVGVAYRKADLNVDVAVVSPSARVEWYARARDHAGDNDSLTLALLIRELRAREAAGRLKYGTDVDRTDFDQAQWTQHLREELMDALLYSLAVDRTVAPKDC